MEKLEVYMSIFGLSSGRTTSILNQNPALIGQRVNLVDVEASAEFLKQNKFSIADLQQRPTTVLINRLTLANRMKVLEECCFREQQLLFISRFVLIMNKEIKTLKAFNYIDRNVKIAEHLIGLLDVPVKLRKDIGESISMIEMRKIIISLYLKVRLEMTNDDIIKLFEVYPRLKNRSLDSIMRVIDLLQNQLGFDRKRILSNMFLLFACPDNLQQMIKEFPEIGGMSMPEILYKRPKIANQNVDSIRRSIEYIRSYGIPDERIAKSIEVLTLSPETIHERLVLLTKTKEFNVLCGHPRVLRLIFHHNKASTRLEYLKQLKVKCMSLHVLSSTSEVFEKYAREGIDRTKGRDVIYYLAKFFNFERSQVRNTLNRHPNWCHVPVISVKASIDYLRYKNFTMEEMSKNLILLMYPVARIEEKLVALMEWKEESEDNRMISGVALSAISNDRLLKLCLYYIETEFHFSGDGIWDPARHDNKQDIFPSSIPEFPKTVTKYYRFGKKKEIESAMN